MEQKGKCCDRCCCADDCRDFSQCRDKRCPCHSPQKKAIDIRMADTTQLVTELIEKMEKEKWHIPAHLEEQAQREARIRNYAIDCCIALVEEKRRELEDNKK